MSRIASVAQLEALHGQPAAAALVKEVSSITPHYRARALVRSDLWNPAHHVDPGSLPSAGQILAALGYSKVGGETYDREWPGRAAKTMW